MWHNGTNLHWVGPVSACDTARLFFFTIVWGLEAAPVGSLQPRHHYLVKIWDNHTVPLLFLVKVPPQLISEPNLFYALLQGLCEKRLYTKTCRQVGFCVTREQREIMSSRVNWEREDVARWFWLCRDNALFPCLTDNFMLEKLNSHRPAFVFEPKLQWKDINVL